MWLVFHRTVVIVKHDKPFADFFGPMESCNKQRSGKRCSWHLLYPFIGFLRAGGVQGEGVTGES